MYAGHIQPSRIPSGFMRLLRREQIERVLIDHLKRLAATACNAGQRVFRNADGQTGFFCEQTIDITQQCAAAGQHQTAFSDIGRQFGRRLLQGALHSHYNCSQRFLQRIKNLVRIQREATRYTFSQVATTHVNLAQLGPWIGTADLFLDAFGSGFTDQAAIMTTHIGSDGFVETVTAHTHGFRIDDTGQRNDRDFGRTTTDIHHHRPLRFFDLQAGTDSSSHRFFNQEHFTRTSAFSGFLDRTPFHLSGHAGHADQHTRAGLDEGTFMYLTNEMLQHLFGNGEVSNDAVLHRPNRRDVTGCTPQHAFGIQTDGCNGLHIAGLTDGHYGGLVENDISTANINQGIGRAQVDR
ncbi:homoserine acetyltransferase [Zymobacter palmae]|uniref:Homoserine acetyltransferase n=1 Tax=Zymobacter palmae TaxID=33074 RepID=A0A348HGY1_9GAMM|nr:homoserine acetyltransferase [Zymobacter palmae]